MDIKPWNIISHLRSTNFRRKVVPVYLDGKKVLARPDSGSDSDAMSADFAKEHGFSIRRSESDKVAFELGNGKIMTSIGTTYIPCVLPDAGYRSEKRLFHVFEKCAFPLLLGLEFISKTSLFQKFRYLLQDAPSLFGGMPMLKRVGKPQGWIDFTADGRSLSACPDTGSDLNFMSFRCAKRNCFTIDRSPEFQTQVMVADTSVVQTIGVVNISFLSVKGHYENNTTFYILPGLSCDAIFSEEFLDDIDAFNTCVEIRDGMDLNPFSLNTLINLGRVQGFLSKTFGRKSTKQTPIASDEAEHVRDMENEDYRRNNFKRALSGMTIAEQADANRIEDARLRSFNSRHDRCQYCVNRRTSSRPGRPPE